MASQATRRQFMTMGGAALLAAHHQLVTAFERSTPERSPGAEAPRLRSLELLTSAPLPAMRDFYLRVIGLPVLEERPDRLSIGAGSTRVTFQPAPQGVVNPFYHFAFNIPENKILSAFEWQKARTPLLAIPARLRDPAFPDGIVDYRHWNAHSVFFLDPGGNVVEYIARHDLKNSRPGPFGVDDILYASEIAFVVDEVRPGSDALKPVAGVGQYRGGDDQFIALGDEVGLLLVMRRGRILDFHPTSTDKAAAVFPTVASISGPKALQYSWPGFPYTISVS